MAPSVAADVWLIRRREPGGFGEKGGETCRFDVSDRPPFAILQTFEPIPGVDRQAQFEMGMRKNVAHHAARAPGAGKRGLAGTVDAGGPAVVGQSAHAAEHRAGVTADQPDQPAALDPEGGADPVWPGLLRRLDRQLVLPPLRACL